MEWIPSSSIHLVLTSPPYWTLKPYPAILGQLARIEDYESFMDELDKVWRHCLRVLVPGGRLVCVVGDVCIARRRNQGRHMVVPLHADISVRARRLGFDYLTPIYWHKISNAHYEVNNGSFFLGRPFEPNAIVKNEVEYILMLRKPGGYRNPSPHQRGMSKFTRQDHAQWFRSFWMDIPGASTRNHPAPFPIGLAVRLIRMFSFAQDIVLDPFAGTMTTTIAAMRTERSSISNELEPRYVRFGARRVSSEFQALSSNALKGSVRKSND